MKEKIFSPIPKLYQFPYHLNEIQFNSYQWFKTEGLRELFDEINPVRDYTGKNLALYFEDFYFEEPKYSEKEAKEKGLTYQAPLRVKLRLQNFVTKKETEQEVFFGEYPMMTSRGTFIVNGVERVVVSQIIRSCGGYFTCRLIKGKKYFGAKIIPNRGCWFEFETEGDNAIYVRIDRRRKIPVTTLLRIFGLESDEEILKTFKDVDVGPIKFIEKTLAKDKSKNKDSAFVEIYKRLRPGDLATPDNARSLIEAMLYRPDRYDLSEVGRFKLNQLLKLNFPLTREYRHLHLEDIVEIVKGIIKRNNDPLAEPDDIDHLSNRRIRPVGELVQERARVGLARLRRIIQDRMSTADIYTLTPAKLINYRPLEAIVRDFFTLGSLSQFMDQANPLSALEHKRRISAMGPGGLTRERAGFEVRDVHPSHYGRICPIQTPEGINIGLVNHLANFARINPFGFLITPYFKVKNGKITNEIVWLTALEEEEYKIAHGGTPRDKEGYILPKIVEVRYRGRPTQCKREEVDLIDVAPYQIVSISTSLIPFLEHDDANRALMGSNMQRQAVPCLKAEPPLVQTGNEKKAAYDSGMMLISDVDGKVIEVDASKIVIQPKGKPKERKVYWLEKFSRTNQYTCHHQFPKVKLGQQVKKGDPLVDTNAIKDGVLSLGKNLLVAFMPFRGGNFEDAIIISERLVKEDVFTSIHIEDFECEVRETRLGPEVTTPDIPNVSEEKLKDLDEEGIVRIGAEVNPGDILVGKISPKGEAELSPEERLLRAVFGEKAKDIKDTSLLLPGGKRGRVIRVRVFSREKGEKLEPGVIKKIQVEVAQIRKITAGDKLAGRHGNKGVVAKVLPEEDMPYLEDGTPVDIILNPLSVASRMNIGQILETHLGWAAKKLGYYAITPALAGASEEQIKEELKKAGLPEDGKVTLYDGYTGEPFDQKVTVGYIYMMKLNHLVEDKIHMRSIGPYSLITQQPLRGKAHMGGQRFGEMEVWALEGYGAAYTLQEMLTVKSDDVKGRAQTYEAIIKGEKIKTIFLPASFNVLVCELKALGLSVQIEKEKTSEKAQSAKLKAQN